jgi:hypothetical protein
VANPAGKSLGVAIGDIDGDGWPDIFVANDGVRNFLYRNNGNGTFADITYGAGVGYDGNGKALAGMGTEIADVDGDGLPDIFFTAFSDQYNPLYRNLGKLLFEDGTVKAGLPSCCTGTLAAAIFAMSRRKAVRRFASSTWAAVWRWRISITMATWTSW